MIITVASFKGGVGKSTTAIHLAAYLATIGKTVFADGDLNRSVLHWSERGNAPFTVYDQNDIVKAKNFEHFVIDTPARPAFDELKALAQESDLLALIKTVGMLNELPPGRFKVLLTCVPPHPSREGDKARNSLLKLGLPLFKNWIRRMAVYLKAENFGVPVYMVKDPRATDAWSDYEAVGKEILR